MEASLCIGLGELRVWGWGAMTWGLRFPSKEAMNHIPQSLLATTDTAEN